MRTMLDTIYARGGYGALVHVDRSAPGHIIRLYRRGEVYAVQYGRQLDHSLTYGDAAARLGEAVLHRLQAAGRTSHVEPSIGDLADEFIRVIKEWLSARELDAVRRRNDQLEAQGRTGVCATHDFCDANMAMHEAYVRLTGTDPFSNSTTSGGGLSASRLELMSAAWSWAKALRFK